MGSRLEPELQRVIESHSQFATKSGCAALRRLVEWESAIQAWRALGALKPKKGGDLAWAVHWIASAAARGELKTHERHTSAEIAAAARKAKGLALDLVDLMGDYESLRFMYEELRFPGEEEVWDRVLFGIAHSGYKFAPAVEADLDRGFQKLSTADAYKTLSYQIPASDDLFVYRLKRFADLAADSAKAPPAAPHPRRENVSARRFAISAARTIAHNFQGPHIDIVTALTSAAFDLPNLDAETVKQWWRRRDKSKR